MSEPPRPTVAVLLALVVLPTLAGAAGPSMPASYASGGHEPYLAGSSTATEQDRPPPAGRSWPTDDCPTDVGSDGYLRAVYPNPVADGDRGEYVLVDLPADTNLTGWRLADDDATVALPNRTVTGPVAVSSTPESARNSTDHPVVAVDDGLALSNAGENLTLSCDGRPVDSTSYEDAPESELWTGRDWQPLGATNYSPTEVRNATVRLFGLPDAPTVPLRTLRSADRRILLAGYTFASERVAGALRRARERGVEVRVLLDASPVGGMGRREARLLDGLAGSGVEVRVLAGPHARYAFHHPKYAVVDDRVLVTSENWKPSGTGGRSNRGWGVVVRDGTLTAAAATVFREDADWRAATPWRSYRRNRSFEPASTANGTFPTRFEPRTVRAERVRLLVAPDNAEREVVGLLRDAIRSVDVEQVSVERGSRFLQGIVAAARRGVRVRVLLSGAWYVREENRRTADRLNRLAEREGLALTARLVEPRSRFGKVHVKGLVVDDEHVVVGSLNWNNNSARENREVAVVLSGDEVGSYYGRLFRADWRGGAWRLPVGVAVALGVAVVVAVGVGRRRISFERGS